MAEDNVVNLADRRKTNNIKDIKIERQDIEEYLAEAEAFQTALAKKREKQRRNQNFQLCRDLRAKKTPDDSK